MCKTMIIIMCICAGFLGQGIEAVKCTENEKVVSNACVACPAGTTRSAGDDASGAGTTCDATTAVFTTTARGGDTQSAQGYVKKTSGSCDYPITSSSECERAAQSLGLADTSAADDGRGRGWTANPPYCYYAFTQLLFNSDGQNTGSCSSTDHCLCHVEARTTTTTTMASYLEISSGKCIDYGYMPITSKEACELAATMLNLYDFTADVGSYHTAGRPEGCHYQKEPTAQLFLNTYAGSIGNGYQLVPSREPLCQQPYFLKISSGKCSDYGYIPITSKEACELAATRLGLHDLTADVGSYDNYTAGRPEGCHYELQPSAQLFLNTYSGSIGNGVQLIPFSEPLCQQAAMWSQAGPPTSTTTSTPTVVLSTFTGTVSFTAVNLDEQVVLAAATPAIATHFGLVVGAVSGVTATQQRRLVEAGLRKLSGTWSVDFILSVTQSEVASITSIAADANPTVLTTALQTELTNLRVPASDVNSFRITAFTAVKVTTTTPGAGGGPTSTTTSAAGGGGGPTSKPPVLTAGSSLAGTPFLSVILISTTVVNFMMRTW